MQSVRCDAEGLIRGAMAPAASLGGDPKTGLKRATKGVGQDGREDKSATSTERSGHQMSFGVAVLEVGLAGGGGGRENAEGSLLFDAHFRRV